MTRRDTSAEIDAAAADWAARVNNAPLSPEEQAELDAWLEGDSRRLGAYARVRAMFSHAKRIQALGPSFDPDAFAAEREAERQRLDPQPPVLQPEELPALGHTSDNDDEYEGPSRYMQPSRRRFLLAGGGAIATTVIGVAGFSWQAAAQTYSTKRGEIRLIPLVDGSSMTLNTESTAKVRFSDRERHVELVQGEALFEVAKDGKRPFVVAAGNTSIRAIGTSFSVARLADRPVQVVVKQGEVELIQPNRGATPPQRIGANTRTIVSATAPIKVAAVAPEELGRALAWREGMLSFEDMPLKQAIQEFARYNDTRILLADPALGEEPVTGLFAANNPVGFAQTVAASLGIHSQTAAGTVTIRR